MRHILWKACVVAGIFALGITAHADVPMLGACGINCGIEECPEQPGYWCNAVGCYGSAACGGSSPNCGGGPVIVCDFMG